MAEQATENPARIDLSNERGAFTPDWWGEECRCGHQRAIHYWFTGTACKERWCSCSAFDRNDASTQSGEEERT